jgi:hypothetical protein
MVARDSTGTEGKLLSASMGCELSAVGSCPQICPWVDNRFLDHRSRALVSQVERLDSRIFARKELRCS